MKRSQIAFALLATFAAASNSVSLACDKCKSNCKTCTQCDDRGLLDVVDLLAGRLQKSLEDSRPKLVGGVRSKGSCDQPTCGCEAVSVAKPTCGCESSHAAPRLLSSPIDEQWAEPPMTHRIPKPVPHVQSPPQETPDSQISRGESPTAVPIPVKTDREANPRSRSLPDEAVDPFTDDAASRIRKIPATSIQYQRPVPRYVDQYDPQAANRYRVRVGDRVQAPQSARAVGQSPQFETVQSSRRGPVANGSISDAGVPAVVTASGSSRLQPIRSTDAGPLPSREEVRRSEEAYYANPLR